MLHSRSGKRKGLERPPVHKQIREGDAERKAPAPQQEGDEDGPAGPGPEKQAGVEGAVRRRGSWIPGDSTL